MSTIKPHATKVNAAKFFVASCNFDTTKPVIWKKTVYVKRRDFALIDDGTQIKTKDTTGKSCYYKFSKDEAGKYIKIYAYVETYDNLCQTILFYVDPQINTDIRIKDVNPKEKKGVVVGDTITCSVIYHKPQKKETIPDNKVPQPTKDNVKWKVKIGDEKEDGFIINGEMMRGGRISFKVPKEWDNKDILLMPYLNKWKESVAQKIEVKCPITLYFDGDLLVLRIIEESRILRFSYKAASGRVKDGKFDYSKERQAEKGNGPIPEGEYYINPQQIQYTEDRDTVDELKGVIGGGTFPGGTRSWGIGRVWIYPQSVIVINPINGENVTRDKFSIHGGSILGSAGCIDLTSNDRIFFKELTKYRKTLTKIPLTVKYKL